MGDSKKNSSQPKGNGSNTSNNGSGKGHGSIKPRANDNFGDQYGKQDLNKSFIHTGNGINKPKK